MLKVGVDFGNLKNKRKKLFFILNFFCGEHNGRFKLGVERLSARYSAFVRLSVSVWQKKKKLT